MTEVSAGTLTDFLLARIAEDMPYPGEGRCSDGREQLFVTRRRAECAAKRRIVERVVYRNAAYDSDPTEFRHGELFGVREALRLLAQPYADHPDFRPEWRR